MLTRQGGDEGHEWHRLRCAGKAKPTSKPTASPHTENWKEKTLSGRVCLGPVCSLCMLIRVAANSPSPHLLPKGQWCTDNSVGTRAPGECCVKAQPKQGLAFF